MNIDIQLRQFVYGLPASGKFTIAEMPSNGDTVTIDDVVYTYGTDFVGASKAAIARSLALLLRADPGVVNSGSNQPIKSVYAVAYDTVVRLIATIPGTNGNSITLATSNATAFVKSSTHLTGGTDNSPAIGTVSLDPSSVTELVAAIGAGQTLRYLSTITAASGSGINDINSIATAGLGLVGTALEFNNSDNSSILETWILRSGTDAQVSQQKRRPQDYDGSTNAVFWERNS